MSKKWGVALLLVSTLAIVGAWVGVSRDSSAAGPVRRVIIPAIASDSPPTTTTREVVFVVDLRINEPAYIGGGTTIVNIQARGHGPLPGQFDPPVTIPVTFEITTHPGDVCAWNPIVNGNLTITYSQPQGADLRLLMNFSGADWFYQVECPAQTIRFPAGSVNESLSGWVGLVYFGTGFGGPSGAIIDTPVVSENPPSCVKRKGEVSNTNQFGTGTVTVWVTDPPCLIVLAE